MNWIQTKAGLQMAQTIIRQLPELVSALHRIANLLQKESSPEDNCLCDEGTICRKHTESMWDDGHVC